MSKYNPKYHNRRSIRLKGYDYAQEGLYFVTIVVKERKHLFGRIEKGIMHLNAFGIIVLEEWEKTIEIRPNCSLGAFVVMPDHFHAILSIDYSKNKKSEQSKEFKASFKSPSQTLGAIIRGFKGACSKRIKNLLRETDDSQGGNVINDRKPPRIFETGVLQYAPSENLYSFKEISNLPYPLIKGINLSKSIWQRNYHDKIIWNKKAFQNISRYIKNNPKKWCEDQLK
jgi:REP element-mobilizing transposase RayT